MMENNCSEYSASNSQDLEDNTLQKLSGVSVYDSATIEKDVVLKINRALYEKEIEELTKKIKVYQQSISKLKNSLEQNEKACLTISQCNYSEATLLKLKAITSQNEKLSSEIKILENKLIKVQFNLQVRRQEMTLNINENANPSDFAKQTEDCPVLQYDGKAVATAKSLKERSELIRHGLATPFSLKKSGIQISSGALKLDDTFDDSLSFQSSSTSTNTNTSKALKRKLHIETSKTFLNKKLCTSDDSDEYRPSSLEDELENESDSETTCSNPTQSRQRFVVDDANPKTFKKRLGVYRQQLVKEQLEGICPPNDKVFDGGLKVPGKIWKKLYKYQQTGVKWLWELHLQQTGGILGDEMGLGKTVQVIAFLSALYNSKIRDRDASFSYDGLGPVLIVAPTTVMHQWVREFHKWAPFLRVAVLHSSGSHKGSQRDLINNIVLSRGVLVTSYQRVRLAIDNLLGQSWHYVILDEGHKIRNPEAAVTHAVKLFPTPHRIILSGSPIQNHLRELWSLFDFIFPGKLGTLPVFMEQFSVPIIQGGYASASEVEVQTAYKCACMLRDTISPYLLRRMKQDVQSHIKLPEKNDQVLFCSLTPHQVEVYESYLKSDSVNSILSGKLKVFVGLIQLRKICNHPDLVTGGPKILTNEPALQYGDERRYGFFKRSGKMIVIESLLKIWKKQGKKVLLFTQSKKMLDVLEDFVKSQAYSYLSMHGGSSIGSRQPLINKFNEDPSIFVFILTTRVGGLGVNLIGADRVVIYDPDWNPSTDAQAQERAWRIGQNKQVTIYRLLTTGTIEEKIYHRQIFKHFVSNRVLKDPRQRRFFKANDMHELFVLGHQDHDLERKKKTETAAIFAGTGSEIKINPKRTKSKKKTSFISTSNTNKQNDWTFQTEPATDPAGQGENSQETNNGSINKLNYDVINSAAISCSASSSNNDKGSFENSSNQISPDLVSSSSWLNSSINNAKENSCSSATDKEELLSKSIKLKTSFQQALKKFQQSRQTNDNNQLLKEKPSVDGVVVANVMKKSKYKVRKDDRKEQKKSDDYVLSRLFSKGVHSALKHTTIMESGVSDYALVEAEANRVAKEAAKKIRLSRQRYKYPQINNSKSKPRFGNVPSQKSVGSEESKIGGSSFGFSSFGKSGPLSSSELLQQIRKRNHIEKPGDDDDDAVTDNVEMKSFKGDLFMGEDDKLMSNLVEFLTKNKEVSTQIIMSKFKDLVSTKKAPIFKAMLHKTCIRRKSKDGIMLWSLKEEF